MNISKNKDFKEEYCSSIVRIGELFPIEGKDRIVKTLVNGLSIVVGKSEFRTGDVAVYCANETCLHELFLHLNDMYDDRELNSNPENKGYINHHGRVRMIRLGGVPSYGILLHPDSIARFINEPEDKVRAFLESHVGEDFDEINGERFIQVYVPPVKERTPVPKSDRRQKKLDRFKMLIDGSFRFHYDTSQLAKNMGDINPDDSLFISNKLHGTSGIFSNILTNVPTPWYRRLWRKLTGKDPYDKAYNIVYSSRTVIKNQYINPKQKDGGYYSDDVWGYWAKKLDGYIPKDHCIYGEIVGFTPNGTPIQKGYDYGCSPDGLVRSKLMIYRMTENGHELDIPEVSGFGEQLETFLPGEIIRFPLMYHGTLKELYPDLDVNGHWHENVLERLKNEKKFGMEELEPMCMQKVPREGFVVRKENDPIAEAWKLKTDKFRMREASQIDAGEVDIETAEGYVPNDGE